MPKNIEPLQHGSYYHIYNRGINGETLFREPDNYRHFLRLYEKYVDLVAETFAWCLLKNHFHLLVRIKDEDDIVQTSRPDRFSKPVRSASSLKQPHQYFSNLFNAYTKSYNKKYCRHGTLFERPFRRINITYEQYFRNMVFYIHNNPVKHGFVKDMVEYPWSSYLSILSMKPTKLQRNAVIGWFDSRNNFKTFHQKEYEENEIENFIIE